MEENRGVIDYRQHKFVQVTKSIIDDVEHFDKPVDKLVYVILCSYADNKTKESWPSIQSLAKKACCSEHTVRRSIKKLQELKVIEVRKRFSKDGKQQSNCYLILEPPLGFNVGVSNT